MNTQLAKLHSQHYAVCCALVCLDGIIAAGGIIILLPSFSYLAPILALIFSLALWLSALPPKCKNYNTFAPDPNAPDYTGLLKLIVRRVTEADSGERNVICLCPLLSEDGAYREYALSYSRKKHQLQLTHDGKKSVLKSEAGIIPRGNMPVTVRNHHKLLILEKKLNQTILREHNLIFGKYYTTVTTNAVIYRLFAVALVFTYLFCEADNPSTLCRCLIAAVLPIIIIRIAAFKDRVITFAAENFDFFLRLIIRFFPRLTDKINALRMTLRHRD